MFVYRAGAAWIFVCVLSLHEIEYTRCQGKNGTVTVTSVSSEWRSDTGISTQVWSSQSKNKTKQNDKVLWFSRLDRKPDSTSRHNTDMLALHSLHWFDPSGKPHCTWIKTKVELWRPFWTSAMESFFDRKPHNNILVNECICALFGFRSRCAKAWRD